MVPEISVILPNFNHSEFLRQRIETVLHQDFDNFELIILDDCSIDNSRDIIEEYRNHQKISHIIYNDFNSGSTFKQWHRGIKLSRGRYIWFAESDDFSEVSFLSTLFKILEADKNLAIAFCQSKIVDEKNNSSGLYQYKVNRLRWEKSFKNFGKEECRKSFLFENSIPNASAALINLQVLKKINTFPSNFILNGDWFLWINLLMHGDLYYFNGPLNNYRNHGNTVRNTNRPIGKDLEEKAKIVDYLLINLKLSTFIKAKLLHEIIYKWQWEKKAIKKENKDEILEVLSKYRTYVVVLNAFALLKIAKMKSRMLIGRILKFVKGDKYNSKL